MAKRDVELRELLDEPKFIEMLARDPFGQGIDLDYWQLDYLRDRSPFVITRKSRRVGYSFAEALKGLIRSQKEVRPMMPYVYSKYFISRNLEESKEKIMLANVFHDMLPTNYRLRKVVEQKTELIFEDARGRKSRLKALTAQPPRGQGGDVDIDEAAWIRDFRKIYESALFLVGEGNEMQMTIGSSPAGQGGLFYEIDTNHGKRYSHFSRYRIQWWLSRNLCTDVVRASIEAPKMSTRERVERFGTRKLREIFQSTTLENFVREAELGYLDESTAYMPYELIMSCSAIRCSNEIDDSEADYYFDYWANEPGVVGKQDPPNSFWERLVKVKKGYYSVGYDVGRDGDISAIVIAEVVHGHKYVRALVHLDRSPFPTQEKIIGDIMRIVKPIKLVIDRRSVGRQLAEMCELQYGSIAYGIAQTPELNAELATAVKASFEKRQITIPDQRELIDHIHSIERTIGGTGRESYGTDATGHHGDFFWALAFTYHNQSEEGPRRYAFGDKRLTARRIP